MSETAMACGFALCVLCAAGCSEAAPAHRPPDPPVVPAPSDDAGVPPTGSTPTEGGAEPGPTDAGLASNIGAACASAVQCRAPMSASTVACLQRIDIAQTSQGGVSGFLEFFGLQAPPGPADDDAGAALDAAVPDLAVQAPGGYCTATCLTDADCGREGACVGLTSLAFAWGLVDAGASGVPRSLGMCLEPCDRNSDCRTSEGYVCRSAGEGVVSPALFDASVFGPPYHCLPPRR